MPSPTPLKGNELVDCAQANLKFGIEEAAKQSGYQDVDTFKQELELACEKMGVKVETLTNLIAEEETTLNTGGIEIAPDSLSEL